MEKSEKLKEAFRQFDEANAQDPHTETLDGKAYPKELLYSQRMTEKLNSFAPEASEALQLTARCQHICRWRIPRETYDMDRVGYLKWRQDLKKYHAEKAATILQDVGYDEATINRVRFLLEKKKLKRDPETQTLEDVICLVFLQYYLDSFMEKHPDDKLVDILAKTWGKMSEAGRNAAMNLPLSTKAQRLISEALNA